MIVRTIMKSGKVFEYRENAVLDDKEAGWAVLLWGKITGGRLTGGWGSGVSKYGIEELSHIAINWNDIERIELLPETDKREEE